MKCAEEYMRLYAVTDRAWVGRQTLYQQVESALKGIRPSCTGVGAGDHFGYDALYARRLAAWDRVRVQFVEHQFIPVKGRLVQVMAYAVGDDERQARELFERNQKALTGMMQSVRLY